MSKGGFFLDTKEFERGIKKITEQTIPSAAEKGLFNAMNALLKDSIDLPPQAPKDMGDLWGSRTGSAENPHETKRTNQEISIIGGFNIKYAHRHHEVPPGTFHYTTTKGARAPGPKYVETKMIRLKDKYMGIVADTIKEAKK
ncbi:MAG: hypothetical protein ACTSPV_00660 [Candidatus Hodarchaeales archaeon]